MDEARRELGNINRQTNTLSDELGELLKKFDEQDDQKFKQEKHVIRRDLQILKGKLKGIAANYEPDPDVADPTDPNITGKPRSATENHQTGSGGEKENKLMGKTEQDSGVPQNSDAPKPDPKSSNDPTVGTTAHDAGPDAGKDNFGKTDQEKKNQEEPAKPWARQSDPANPVNLGRENEFDPINKDVVENNLKDGGGGQPGASGQGVSTVDPTNNPFHQK